MPKLIVVADDDDLYTKLEEIAGSDLEAMDGQTPLYVYQPTQRRSSRIIDDYSADGYLVVSDQPISADEAEAAIIEEVGEPEDE